VAKGDPNNPEKLELLIKDYPFAVLALITLISLSTNSQTLWTLRWMEEHTHYTRTQTLRQALAHREGIRCCIPAPALALCFSSPQLTKHTWLHGLNRAHTHRLSHVLPHKPASTSRSLYSNHLPTCKARLAACRAPTNDNMQELISSTLHAMTHSHDSAATPSQRELIN
jgi:hypothetical protein